MQTRSFGLSHCLEFSQARNLLRQASPPLRTDGSRGPVS